jgi:2-polyprenyl-3-methyl-5-hydroxy-6-metoxy-1,4-benzoquinol methylase
VAGAHRDAVAALDNEILAMTASSLKNTTDALPRSAADAHAAEVARGERFTFGKNWRKFLDTMSEERVQAAVMSVRNMLGRESLTGSRFLDIGSGSGLFSLAAHRLGAEVVSFDYDSDSVGCTNEMRRRYAPDSTDWTIRQGSVLDADFMRSLGQFDVVYSWGVLHHTGAMWKAIDAALERVAPGGWLFISIYNDQGAWSHRWAKIKRYYCSGPLGKVVVCATFIPYQLARDLAADIVWRRNPWTRYTEYSRARGMSPVRDWFDWLGGYPFEVAKPEAIILPVSKRGYRLINLVTCGGAPGCVEYVFRHDPAQANPV